MLSWIINNIFNTQASNIEEKKNNKKNSPKKEKSNVQLPSTDTASDIRDTETRPSSPVLYTYSDLVPDQKQPRRKTGCAPNELRFTKLQDEELKKLSELQYTCL